MHKLNHISVPSCLASHKSMDDHVHHNISTAFDHLHVAILSSPGMGHFIPVLVLANRLATHHGVKVTVFFVTVDGSPAESKLPHHDARVRIVELPPVDISHLVNPSTKIFTKLCLMVRQALPGVRAAVAAMDTRPDAFFVSHFANEALDIAVEFGIPNYVYFPSMAWFTALTVYCGVLDREIDGEYVDQDRPLIIPGCKPLRPVDVVDPMQDRTDQQYEDYLKMGRQIPLFDGILSNSWQDLEPNTFQALRENEILKSVVKIPVYPVGPLKRPVEPASSRIDLKAWLDRQPNESVIYVSFGSGGVLSAEQTTELAWGLELSHHRFLWVARPPTDHVDNAFFDMGAGGGTVSYLPDVFLTRTRGLGLVVPDWAPQVEILNHPAIGGFLSHCGWNSSLESITSGVPMIAWPLYAEQRMNAAFLLENAGVAVRPAMKGVVGREEIGRVVRELMEGEEGKVARQKVKALQKSAADGLRRGGASHEAMCDVLSRIAARKKHLYGRT